MLNAAHTDARQADGAGRDCRQDVGAYMHAIHPDPPFLFQRTSVPRTSSQNDHYRRQEAGRDGGHH